MTLVAINCGVIQQISFVREHRNEKLIKNGVLVYFLVKNIQNKLIYKPIFLILFNVFDLIENKILKLSLERQILPA